MRYRKTSHDCGRYPSLAEALDAAGRTAIALAKLEVLQYVRASRFDEPTIANLAEREFPARDQRVVGAPLTHGQAHLVEKLWYRYRKQIVGAYVECRTCRTYPRAGEIAQSHRDAGHDIAAIVFTPPPVRVPWPICNTCGVEINPLGKERCLCRTEDAGGTP